MRSRAAQNQGRGRDEHDDVANVQRSTSVCTEKRLARASPFVRRAAASPIHPTALSMSRRLAAPRRRRRSAASQLRSRRIARMKARRTNEPPSMGGNGEPNMPGASRKYILTGTSPFVPEPPDCHQRRIVESRVHPFSGSQSFPNGARKGGRDHTFVGLPAHLRTISGACMIPYWLLTALKSCVFRRRTGYGEIQCHTVSRHGGMACISDGCCNVVPSEGQSNKVPIVVHRPLPSIRNKIRSAASSDIFPIDSQRSVRLR